MKIAHKVKRFCQTSDTNCGPHALASLLSFYGNNTSPEKLERATRMIPGIGTYDGWLGQTALALGFKTRITPQNLYVFDPTWNKLDAPGLLIKLRDFEANLNGNLKISLDGYAAFIESGGMIEFNTLSKDILVEKLKKYPLFIGLCTTYLYGDLRPNDPANNYRYGHFVVLDGYDSGSDKFWITDPWHSISFSKDGHYQVKADELVSAMYFAEATYDCTIMEIWQ